MALRNFGDLDHFSPDEELLCSEPLSVVLRVAVATAEVDAEEQAAQDSKRMTMAVFHGEPWT